VTRTRIIAVLITAGIAIILVSTTLGREIYAGRTPTLTSFALVHFAGYLFFLLMPVEALVPIYQAEGHGAGVLVLLAVGTALIAQAIDYGIGRAVREPVIHELIGAARYTRFRETIQRWGGLAVLFFNLFPLSSPNMLLVAGITRYSAPRAFMFSAVGLTVKYGFLVHAFDALVGWMS
jgi:membrane protein YqaA with SNARE-associated domain